MTPDPNDDRTVIAGSSASHDIPPDNALPIGTRLGEFEIVALIGVGGFGIVYRAYDHSLHRTIALKEYMPSALAARSGPMTVSVKSARHAEAFEAGLKSFINEAHLLAQFDHPSLVKVYRFWEANGTAYMVMPFYEGLTVKEALRRLGGAPDENWLKDLLRPLLEALAVIHREQCFHRDIAPDNILILKDGRPVLLDFGAARRVIGDMTQALTVILKPGYAPIEQYAEMPDMKQGPWTDIYALGAVVYFAVTGKPPVPAVGRMMSDTLVPLAETAAGRYSDAFLRGVDGALKVRPEGRPQDVAQMRALLGLGDRRDRPRTPVPGIAAEAGTRTPKTDATPHETPKHDAATVVPEGSERTPFALYAVGAVVLVAVIAGGAFFLLTNDKQADADVTAPRPNSATVQRPPADKSPGADAAPVTSPPVQPAVVDKPFSSDLMLDQILEGRNHAHAVAASVERAQVRIGRDFLRFRVSSSKPGYVYVLIVDTEHTDFKLLYPNTKDRNNRIAPGQTLKLPGAQWQLRAVGPAGTNQFVAIVSDEPRDFGSLKPVQDDLFQKFSLDVAAQLYREPAAPTPLFAGRVVCAAGANCSESYGAAAFSIEEVGGSAETRTTLPSAAESAPAQAPIAASQKSYPVPAAAKSSSRMETKDVRCSDFLQRASLGEVLTPEEQTILKRDCR